MSSMHHRVVERIKRRAQWQPPGDLPEPGGPLEEPVQAPEPTPGAPIEEPATPEVPAPDPPPGV